MTTILVSSVASPTGRLLAEQMRPYVERIIGIDSQPTEFYLGSFHQCPPASRHEEFANFLATIKSYYDVQNVYFCNDHELSFLADERFRKVLKDFNLPSSATVAKFLDKNISQNAAIEAGFSVPRTIDELEYQGSTGCYFAKNRCSFERPKILKRLSQKEAAQLTSADRHKLLVTEFISGQEFTVDTYFDPKRDICETAIRERTIVDGGVCVVARLVNDPELTRKINNFVKMNAIYGFSCSQFIKNEGTYFYIETNTRAGGGLSISLEAGLVKRIHGIDSPLIFDTLIERRA